MAYEFKLPDLGEGLTEGEIARWLVQEGQEIAEDDPLVEIATDKTTVEIPSPAAGVVTSILVAEGEVVPVGTVLVVIGGRRGGARSAQARSDAPRSGVTDAQRRCARRRSCAGSRRSSASTSRRSTGTGPQGRITESGRARRRRGAGAADGGPSRADPRRQAADVRAPHARAPRDPAGHVGRGVRLHRRRHEAAAAARAEGGRGVAAASSRS